MTPRERAEAWCAAWRLELTPALIAEFEAVRAEARREALEEAAQECELPNTKGLRVSWAHARAIRALKEKA